MSFHAALIEHNRQVREHIRLFALELSFSLGFVSPTTADVLNRARQFAEFLEQHAGEVVLANRAVSALIRINPGRPVALILHEAPEMIEFLRGGDGG
jgi:acyl-CoA synthetase (AMP-forming)/AMP-acid ligase II